MNKKQKKIIIGTVIIGLSLLLLFLNQLGLLSIFQSGFTSLNIQEEIFLVDTNPNYDVCTSSVYRQSVGTIGNVPFPGDDCQWRGYLEANKPSINITFSPWVSTSFTTTDRGSSGAIWIKYDVLNQISQQWETLWVFENGIGTDAVLEYVCPNGADGSVAFSEVRGDYDKIRYYCCKNSNDPIPSWEEIGGDIKATACITPMETVTLKYGWGIRMDSFYFPKRITLDSNYIKIEDGKSSVEFKITSYGHASDGPGDYNDFGFINVLWEETSEITIFRLENNNCLELQIPESDRTNNDYDTLEECQTKIIGKTIYYRLENNECSEISIYPNEKKETDFTSLEECKSKIIRTSNTLLIVLLFLGLIVGLTWIYLKVRKKR